MRNQQTTSNKQNQLIAELRFGGGGRRRGRSDCRFRIVRAAEAGSEAAVRAPLSIVARLNPLANPRFIDHCSAMSRRSPLVERGWPHRSASEARRGNAKQSEARQVASPCLALPRMASPRSHRLASLASHPISSDKKFAGWARPD